MDAHRDPGWSRHSLHPPYVEFFMGLQCRTPLYSLVQCSWVVTIHALLNCMGSQTAKILQRSQLDSLDPSHHRLLDVFSLP